MDHPLVAIVGPTGSGKSALALDLADTCHGEIVNCDSVQFYRSFDIGTAKTPVSARRGIPHHFFDVLDPQNGYSAGEYARDARDVIAAISARGHAPVIAGGTGFYLRALLDGLPGLPTRNEELRSNLAVREQRRPGALYRLLSRLDPSAARRIHSHDIQKLIRALEVRVLTHRVLPATDSAEPLRGYRILKIGLSPDRAQLFAKLDARVEAMFAAGLLQEVQCLLAAGATGAEKPFESLGYKQALQHLRGEVTLEQAISATQIETRHYAKRQWTWFRRDKTIEWFHGFGDDPEIVVACLRRARAALGRLPRRRVVELHAATAATERLASENGKK